MKAAIISREDDVGGQARVNKYIKYKKQLKQCTEPATNH